MKVLGIRLEYLVRRKLGVDIVSVSILSGGSFEGASDVNLDGVGPR